jgi:hypothetical protein
MIYLHVTVQIQRGKLQEWSNLYKKNILPLLNKYGQKLVGAWKTSVGTYDEITDLYEFESLAESERIRTALFNDDEIKKWMQKMTALMGHEQSKIMEPLSYLRIK